MRTVGLIIKDKAKVKELTKEEIVAKLEEAGISYDANAKKEELKALLPVE